MKAGWISFSDTKGLLWLHSLESYLIMVWLFITMEKAKFPAVRQDELVISVDWNENIDVNENLKRISDLVAYSGDIAVQTNSFIGEQQFLFNRDYDQSYTEARIYIKAKDYELKNMIEKNSYEFIRKNYPRLRLI